MILYSSTLLDIILLLYYIIILCYYYYIFISSILKYQYLLRTRELDSAEKDQLLYFSKYKIFRGNFLKILICKNLSRNKFMRDA